jgi:hypothetical protein
MARFFTRSLLYIAYDRLHLAMDPHSGVDCVKLFISVLGRGDAQRNSRVSLFI